MTVNRLLQAVSKVQCYLVEVYIPSAIARETMKRLVQAVTRIQHNLKRNEYNCLHSNRVVVAGCNQNAALSWRMKDDIFSGEQNVIRIAVTFFGC